MGADIFGEEFLETAVFRGVTGIVTQSPAFTLVTFNVPDVTAFSAGAVGEVLTLEVVDFVVCFAAGTLIATPRGEVLGRRSPPATS